MKKDKVIEIGSIDSIKTVVGEMHDSEFAAADFGFDSEKKTFFLKSTSFSQPSKIFFLQFNNVEQYEPKNLEKINKGKALAGIFNDIIIRNNGLVLEILSQDLRILLKLSKLEGIFRTGEKDLAL
jgi:hypothetical protein